MHHLPSRPRRTSRETVPIPRSALRIPQLAKRHKAAQSGTARPGHGNIPWRKRWQSTTCVFKFPRLAIEIPSSDPQPDLLTDSPPVPDACAPLLICQRTLAAGPARLCALGGLREKRFPPAHSALRAPFSHSQPPILNSQLSDPPPPRGCHTRYYPVLSVTRAATSGSFCPPSSFERIRAIRVHEPRASCQKCPIRFIIFNWLVRPPNCAPTIDHTQRFVKFQTANRPSSAPSCPSGKTLTRLLLARFPLSAASWQPQRGRGH